MNAQKKSIPDSRKIGSKEVLSFIWIASALLIIFPITGVLKGTFPIFALVGLIVPLVALLRSRDANRIGIRAIRWGEFLKYALLNLAGSLGLMAFFEPWSHTYQSLLKEAITSTRPDTTFAWLVQFPDFSGWIGFVVYAGFVTLFAEELFFRGWLLQWLQNRTSSRNAIMLQATLFTLPQLLAAFILPPLQGLLYAIVYSWLAIGLIGGWAASRTQSIWPSLASATLYNLLMCILVI